MKTCVKCGGTEFSPEGNCRPCKRAYDKEYRKTKALQVSESKKKCYAAKRAEYIARSSEYYATNKEVIAEKGKDYRERNREYILAKKAEYRKKNQEALRAKFKELYEKNKVVLLQKQREYNAKNKEIVSARKKRYYQANSEAIKQKSRDWYSENTERASERQRKYYEANPTVYYNSRTRRRLREEGKISSDIVSLLFEEQGGKCPGCLSQLATDMHLDHVTPLSKGGRHEDANLQLLCKKCNLKKHATPPLEWYKTLSTS